MISPGYLTWNHLEMDVSEQVKVLSIEPEVLQQLGAAHVIRIISGHGKITETHHLFGGVDHQGAINAGSLRLRGVLSTERKNRADR